MTLTRSDLWSLEEYSEKRASFRMEVIAHKKNRELNLTANARLLFEDEMTVRYQIQEMLRIEKVFEAAGIQEELDTYNSLVPDGANWKATLMLEYNDIKVRKEVLAKLIGVEDQVWMQIADHQKIYAIADEDLERENDMKTSSVHFLRFELSEEMLKSAKAGANISTGCDHENLQTGNITLPLATASSLLKDLYN
jgi:hypothetical protein